MAAANANCTHSGLISSSMAVTEPLSMSALARSLGRHRIPAAYNKLPPESSPSELRATGQRGSEQDTCYEKIACGDDGAASMIAHWSPLGWTCGDHGRSAYGRLLPDQRSQTGCSLQWGKRSEERRVEKESRSR